MATKRRRSGKKAASNGTALQEVETGRDDEVRMLHRKVQSLEMNRIRDRSRENLLVETIKGVFEDDPPVMLYKIPPRPKIQKKAREETLVLFLSDVHYGKVTPSYNSAVCEQRLMLVADKIIEIAESRSKDATIKELHLLMGGDMLEGENIFPTQVHFIDKNLLEQSCKEGPAAYVRMVVRLLAYFEKIKITCVPGNHGRNGSKYTTNHPKTNWDRVLYEVMTKTLLGDTVYPRKELEGRLEIVHADDFYAIDRIWEWGLLMVHGEQIRGHAGIPWYGVNKRAHGWQDALEDANGVPESWDFLLFGHFHTPTFGQLNRRYWFCNGTLESTNPYAQEQLAASGTAAQWVLVFDKHFGLIDMPLLYLQPNPSELRRSKMKLEKFEREYGGQL